MGSNQQGDFIIGNGRSSSSSRRGKKMNSEKQKKPQRGLGVAQLEKIRIQSQMMDNYNIQSVHLPFYNNLIMEENMKQTFGGSSSPTFGFHPNFLKLYEDNGSNRFLPPDSINCNSYLNHLGPLANLPLMEDSVEERIRQNHQSYSAGSLSHVSDYSDSQELDLELKLSL